MVPRPALDLSVAVASTADPKAGAPLFQKYCGGCHFSSGYMPNLRTSPMLLEPNLWKATVYDGALSAGGMAGFKRFMTAEQAESIRAYLLDGLKPRR